MSCRFGFALILSALCALPALAEPLPLESFARLPDASRLTLSPGGGKLAATVRIDVEEMQGTGVQVTRLEDNHQDIVLFTDNSRYFINWLQWKDDRTLLVSTYYPSERDSWVGMGQVRGNTREGRLLIIDTDTGEVSNPFPRSFLRRFRILPSGLDQVVDILPDDPDHILMALPGINGGHYNIVYRVNIRNQRRSVVQNSENNILGWSTDRQHRIRVGYHYRDGVSSTRILDLETNQWRNLWPYEIFSEDQVTVAGFGYDPNELYIRAYHEGRLALFRVNLQDPELQRELVLSDPFYDIGGALIYSPSTQEVIGVAHTYENGSYFFNPELQALQRGIDAAMPETKNFVYSLSADLQRYLVYSTSDTDSGTYYLGQRDPVRLQAAAFQYRELPPERMSSVTRYPYKARDGLEIDAWLTLPRGVEGKNLPTIMFPHGGPHARDAGTFDVWAQFFASKGYAVLQMNFRGSSGQGIDFRNAGLQNWGKEMQDDIEDGARRLIEEGIADADRICIVGASYGGYAALMGVVKTPEFYRCAISVNGVSNVYDLVRDRRDFRQRYNVVEEQIGGLSRQLRDISPVNHADQIKAPVLLIHGEMDRQVEIKHSEQMRNALERANKPVEFLSLPNEDHYLSNEANRLATFRAMDAFLDEHLSVSTPREAAPSLQASSSD